MVIMFFLLFSRIVIEWKGGIDKRRFIFFLFIITVGGDNILNIITIENMNGNEFNLTRNEKKEISMNWLYGVPIAILDPFRIISLSKNWFSSNSKAKFFFVVAANQIWSHWGGSGERRGENLKKNYYYTIKFWSGITSGQENGVHICWTDRNQN